jgi:hypothetical protein
VNYSRTALEEEDNSCNDHNILAGIQSKEIASEMGWKQEIYKLKIIKGNITCERK